MIPRRSPQGLLRCLRSQAACFGRMRGWTKHAGKARCVPHQPLAQPAGARSRPAAALAAKPPKPRMFCMMRLLCRLPARQRGCSGPRGRGGRPALLPDPVWLPAGGFRAPGSSRNTPACGLCRHCAHMQRGSNRALQCAPWCLLGGFNPRCSCWPPLTMPARLPPAGQGLHRHPLPAQAAQPQGVPPAEQRGV